MSENLELAETIRAIRRELNQARVEGSSEDLRFRLGAVELELQVEVSNEKGADGGIKVWVVSIGARGSRSSAATHTLKIVLQPEGADGDDVVIHGEIGKKPVV